MNIASTIEFTSLDFIDVNGNTRPFRIDENKRLFIQGDDNVESELPFSINGDILTLNGIDYIKVDSPTYNQKVQDFHDSQNWESQVASIAQQLQSTYNEANNRINQGVFNFVNGIWVGTAYGDTYFYNFGGSNGSGLFSMKYNEGRPTANSFDGCFVLETVAYDISPFITSGRINNNFYIGYQDTNKFNQVRENIEYMRNLTFENFIRNSSLYLPSNSDLKTLGYVNTITLKNCDNNVNPAKIVINNINPDTNQMVLTNGPGMKNKGRTIQIHR